MTDEEIDRLQKELKQEKEKNKELNLENQALFESINCNDDNMLVRRYQKLKDKIRGLLKQVNSSIAHFKATDSNNIMFRIKDKLEDLLKESD